MKSVLEEVGPGLTTTQAPFIEDAQRRGELYIRQPYELYTPENHEAWRRLYAPDVAALGALREPVLSAGHASPYASIRTVCRSLTTSIDF